MKAIILAGGHSERFGQPKHSLKLMANLLSENHRNLNNNKYV